MAGWFLYFTRLFICLCVCTRSVAEQCVKCEFTGFVWIDMFNYYHHSVVITIAASIIIFIVIVIACIVNGPCIIFASRLSWLAVSSCYRNISFICASCLLRKRRLYRFVYTILHLVADTSPFFFFSFCTVDI